MKINELNQQIYYHVTLTKNVASIMKTGLKPMVGDRAQQIEGKPAVFLFKTIDDMEDAILNWLGDEFDEDESLTLLKVNLPPNFPVNHDKSVGYEYFTFKTIPPEYLTKLKVI